MPLPSVHTLGKVALVGAVATVGMAVASYLKHQEEMRSSTWLKQIREELNNHTGVHMLIGSPPISLGTIERRKPTYELPSVDIDPPAPHLVTVNVKGDKGKGILYAWLNNPTGKKIESVNDWNVAHVELQIGNNRDKKMPINLN